MARKRAVFERRLAENKKSRAEIETNTQALDKEIWPEGISLFLVLGFCLSISESSRRFMPNPKDRAPRMAKKIQTTCKNVILGFELEK